MANMDDFDPTVLPPDASCPFCTIADAYAPYAPEHTTRGTDLDAFKVSPPAFVILYTPLLVAFLDILPLSQGHILLCTRKHRPKLTDVTSEEAAQLGVYLRVLSAALVRTTGVPDWNVVQNNGAAAAQVVNHVHYHLIPRPEIRASGRFSESFTMFGRGTRHELDDDEAAELARVLRGNVARVLREETNKGKL